MFSKICLPDFSLNSSDLSVEILKHVVKHEEYNYQMAFNGVYENITHEYKRTTRKETTEPWIITNLIYVDRRGYYEDSRELKSSTALVMLLSCFGH